MEHLRTNTYEYGHISIVVHRPALSDNERQKREAALRRAVVEYGKVMVRKESE